ncbi:MAG: hypothetical protein CSYNP_02361 [Syntrophus sp. SKADARSKE-3]|nr:hypothetical protein [Syntrophus sp. SKADARSKE-3]
MKIYKKNEHSLLIKPFGIGDRLYLAVTVMLYLDLLAPDSPLTEQELWKTIPDQLKPTPLLDMGMPKPHAEVLLTGSCFAPRGTTLSASPVMVRVGTVHKELVAFGDRLWRKHLRMPVITDPAPFSEMPVTWPNAFGGEDFEQNPVGKGIKALSRYGEEPVIHLPNIEYPRKLMVSPDQRPMPAGFGPLDMMWPQRRRKTGTYDDKWLRERWPWFPEDMDYEFFNCAPEDQYLPDFFRGDEAIDIAHMHPDMPHISSALPGLRIRCFVTKKEAPKSEVELFQDVSLRIDTVWLFPSILRGVVMYRGTTEIFDEEYGDVVRIFLATERLADPPGTIEYYLEEQRKAMDRSVPVNTAAAEAGAKKVGDAMKRLKRIPEDIDDAVKQAVGKAPVMPTTPARTAAQGKQVINDNLALLDRLETQAKGMQAEHGHRAYIDLTMFDRLRGKLRGMSENIDRDLAKLEAAMAKVAEAKTTALNDFSKQMKLQVTADELAEAGIDPDHLLPGEKSVNPWHDQGFPFAVRCRQDLEDDSQTLQALQRLGLTRRTIKRAWLGIHRDLRIDERVLWDLKPRADQPGREGDLDLPPGLVLPRFQEATLNRLLILPPVWEKDGDATSGLLIDGSAETPFFHDCEDEAPVICVADELQALYCDQEIGDACSVVALAKPGDKPDKEAADKIKSAAAFLIVFPEGATEKDKTPWIKAYPKALPYPLPKGRTVFEARRLGVDIRDWLMEAMPADFVLRHRVAPVLPAPGKPPTVEDLTVPVPKIDVQAIIDKSSKEINAYLDGNVGHLPALRADMEQKMTEAVREAAVKGGLDPEAAIKAAANPGPPPGMAASGNTMADQLLSQIPVLAAAGALTPEVEQKMRAEAAQYRKIGQEAEERFQAGMAKLEDAKKTIAETIPKVKAQEMPEAAKAKFLEYGMDPDRMVKRSREEVIAMYGRGESLSFAHLSGVDLSGLDLPGIDLRQTHCSKTLFIGTNLEGADLTQIVALEADFSQASLKGCQLAKAVFIKSKLAGTVLQNARFSQTTIKDSDLTGADLSGAVLFMSTLIDSPLTRVRMTGSQADLCILSGADASEADFREARFIRCILQKLTVNNSDFSRVAFPSSILMEVTGEKTVFRGADMNKGRMGNGTALPGADLRDIQLTQGCFRDSNLAGAKFTGSKFEGALLENCDLQGCDLYAIVAKGSRLSKCNLEGADMRYINLMMGSLRKSRLVNTDLRGANLFCVDFYKSIMGKTRMEGANIKKSLLNRRIDVLEKEEGVI